MKSMDKSMKMPKAGKAKPAVKGKAAGEMVKAKMKYAKKGK